MTIMWERLDQPGHDVARLVQGASVWMLEGTAVFADAGRPCRLEYRVVCDAQWRTLTARVLGWLGRTVVHRQLTADGERTWTLDGEPLGAVSGCHDADLSFTPATNLLPIRRLRLAVGERQEARAAWLRVPELTVEPLAQTYERLGERTYRYESGGAFTAVLQTNTTGFVTDYLGLWQCVCDETRRLD